MFHFIVTFCAFGIAIGLMASGYILTKKVLFKGCGFDPDRPGKACPRCGKKSPDDCDKK